MHAKQTSTQKERLALSLMQKLEGKKQMSQKASDALLSYFGTLPFLTANFIIFAFWILANLGAFPWVAVFDPYPFGLLTMIVSLEAIFLSVIVLISQSRESGLARLRTELDLVVAIEAEEEITRIIKMLDEIHDHMGLNPKDDKELTEMKKNIDINHLRELLVKQH